MGKTGFVKIHRSILTWEWYTDTNIVRLFLHLLLTVNYEPGRWRGMEINRGQRVCSLPVLSEETGLSVQQTRTALKCLVATGSITEKTTNKYRLITVVNYDKFQDIPNAATGNSTDNPTDNQQTINRQPNRQSTAIKEIKNKEIKNKEIKNIPPTPLNGGEREKPKRKVFVKPTEEEVAAYCRERNNGLSPGAFIDFYESKGWLIGKSPMRDWKAAVRTWEQKRKEEGNAYGNGNHEPSGTPPVRRQIGKKI